MDKFVYATQYYRSPTPLENEWDEDLSNLENFNLNIIQIRINWRNNERKEDVYDFSDIDKLIDLAEKHHKQIIIKFLLECAPQYIFDKYDGTRIGPRGEKIRGGYHGAFYGGWLPCFTNPKIKERAAKFVYEVVNRYHNRKSIILYNAWNEIRNRPIEECFCDQCKKEYQEYLRNKFKTIEKLNDFYGASEESFETIDFPSTPHGVWDTYEFKKYKGEYSNYQKVRIVYDSIRKIDKTTPIMCHVGYTCGFQDNIGDVINDFHVSKAVDFWGTSIPFDHHLDTFNNRMDMQLLVDFLRAVCPNFFVHEVYPSLGMYRLYDSPYELKYKLFKILSSGAKGLCFWQYRSERVGHEMDCSGLAYMNGKPRKVLKTVTEVGDFVNKYNSRLMSMHAKQNETAILFDFDSQLLSEIEDTFGPDYKFDLWNPLFYYKKAHQGLYRLINSCDYKTDYLSTSNIDDIFKYKLVFVPYLSMLNKDISETLEKYVSEGGVVVLDEGFGLRTPNTWVQPYDIDVKFMSSWLESRLREPNTIVFNGKKINVGPYNTVYRTKNSKVICDFINHEPAIQEINYKKGKVYQLGFSLGYLSYDSQDESNQELLNYFFKQVGIKSDDYSDIVNGIETNVIENENETMVFLFNTSNEKHCLNIKETIQEHYGDGEIKNNEITLAPYSFDVLLMKK